MKRSLRLIVCAFALATCVSATAAELTDTEAHTALTAVSKREAYVFASTIDGLFRAPLATKRWERLKTPPDMPLNGTFAKLPAKSPLVIYVVYRKSLEKPAREGLRYGLYLSRDNGTNWKLISERDDFGETLLLPNGFLFAVTGHTQENSGNHLLRSPDMGKTWLDIWGKGMGHVLNMEPDPNHPGLVRAQVWGGVRTVGYEAEDENYQWKLIYPLRPVKGRLSSDKFFSRSASSTNRLYAYFATLANYFRYDFGDGHESYAFDVVPLKDRYEFTSGAGVRVKIRALFHFDAESLWPERREALDRGQPLPKSEEPREKFADQPDGTEFWGIRVETADLQVLKYPGGRSSFMSRKYVPENGKSDQPPAVKYDVFDLAPSKPYERELDLSKIFDFSKPGEYRVQVVYGSGGIPIKDRTIWDGHFSGAVFTVVIRP